MEFQVFAELHLAKSIKAARFYRASGCRARYMVTCAVSRTRKKKKKKVVPRINIGWQEVGNPIIGRTQENNTDDR